MELHYLLSDTPTTVSSCSTDPLYDNCPPFAQRNRSGEKEMESKVVSPAVSRLPGPCSPGSALSPAVAVVPTWFGGGRAPGAWPDHSYCSWGGGLGRQGWAAPLGSGRITGRGGGGGERGGGQGGSAGRSDRPHLNPSPDPSHSDQHRSALSLYDNIPDDDVTPDNLQQDFEIEPCFLEHVQEQLCQIWAPEHFQGVMEGEGVSEDKSQWSSCEIILSAGVPSNQDQDKKEERGPEVDSGFSGLQEVEQSLLQIPVSPHIHTQIWPPAEVQHLEQASWSPRIPPPIPQADPSASALRSLLTSLQQQIVRQRDEYERRITR